MHMEEKEVYFTVPDEDEIDKFGLTLVRVGKTSAFPNYRFIARDVDLHTMLFVRSGRGFMRTPSRSVAFSSGDVVIFFKHDHCEWWTDPQSPLSHHWIGLDGPGARSLLERITGGESPFVLTRPAMPAAEMLAVEGLVQLLKYRPPQFMLKAIATFVDICYSLAVHAGGSEPAPSVEDERTPHRIRRFIETNFAQPITVERLAATFGMSPVTLTRMFKEEFGKSPYTYLLERRLTRAKHLLAQGASIKEAAISVGYHDANYFSRLFRRKVGIPPSRLHTKG